MFATLQFKKAKERVLIINIVSFKKIPGMLAIFVLTVIVMNPTENSKKYSNKIDHTKVTTDIGLSSTDGNITG